VRDVLGGGEVWMLHVSPCNAAFLLPTRTRTHHLHTVSVPPSAFPHT
jgi:hypothetical protein